jgi:uncharacterized protein (TIGR01777 family)
MLLPFRLGLGGRVGSGRQWWSWIARNDLMRAICFLLRNTETMGPFNAVSPQAATNAEFTRALGRALGRPTLFPAPSFALRIMLGEMADAALLASQRVAPKRLIEAGFSFEQEKLEESLASMLRRA